MTTALYLLSLLMAVLIAAIADLVSDEVRARLDRLPLAVLAAAARRLPPDLRPELYEQAWLPELHFLLQGDEAVPITRQHRRRDRARPSAREAVRARPRDRLPAKLCSRRQCGVPPTRRLPHGRRHRLHVMESGSLLRGVPSCHRPIPAPYATPENTTYLRRWGIAPVGDAL